MSNMSYCRFQNTVNDLADCAEHIHATFGTTQNDRAEHLSRARLVELCQQIVEELDSVSDGDPRNLGTDLDSETMPREECPDCGEAMTARGTCFDCQ